MSSNTRPIKIMTRFIFEYQCIAGICSDNQAETNPKPKPTCQLPFIVFLCVTPKFSIPQTPVLIMYLSLSSLFLSVRFCNGVAGFIENPTCRFEKNFSVR